MLNFKTFSSSRRSSKKSGFTLIELSIVLIIIGLLVAGVTGGASLIRSAQLRSVMSEARGYNVAVNAFVVQYDDLPGDYGTIIGGTIPSIAGDGDGEIEYLAGQLTGNGSFREGTNAWLHLINSGTIDDTIALTDTLSPATTVDAAAQAIGTNMPDSKLDGVGWMFTNSTNTNFVDTNVVIATGAIAAVASVEATTDTNFIATGAMTPTDALSIDTKLDDGLGHTGRVQSSELIATPANCSVVATGVYATGTATDECALEFTVDIS
jgi:prepilin-type N-terminal cleavage/methylation domain-containing protein